VTASKNREAMNWFHQQVCRSVRWRGRLKGPIALAASDMLTLLLYFNFARWLLAPHLVATPRYK
jgi:hypothetical protein